MTFSHLSKHKFRHKFRDCVNPMCKFGTEIKTINHFFFVLPIPSQWKTKSPWSPLPDRSFNYNLWWRISITSFYFMVQIPYSEIFLRFNIPWKLSLKAQPHTMTYISSHQEVFYKKVFLKFLQNSQENSCTGVYFSCNFNKK